MIGWRVENGKDIPITRSKSGFATKKEALEYAPMLKRRKDAKKCLNDYWLIWSNDDMTRLSGSKQTAYEIAYKKLGHIVYDNIDEISL